MYSRSMESRAKLFEPESAAAGDLVLVGLPADDKSSYARGSAKAPGRIREALACPSSNLCAENGLDLGAEAAFKDGGDLDLRGKLDAAAIDAALGAVLDRGAKFLALGGDHAVSYPAIKAYALRAGGRADVLHIDAHPDLYDSFGGDRLSHACPFARLLEEGLIGRLVQVGIRGMNPEQRRLAEARGVELIDMAAWERGSRPAFAGPFYLSLDLDGLDPAFAPGVSHREPGGLSVRDAIGLVQGTPGILACADIVEYNPDRDWDGMTAMVAAKLLKEIAGRILRGPAPRSHVQDSGS
jgi:arginase